uniref:Bm1282 n=1 Tax=Brugia malayi TaxID=6279 RepID=A0A0H5S5Z4_BRUMA|nr:Bm1282 [Brugia malayi]
MHLPSIFAYLLPISTTIVCAVKCYCTDDHCVPYGVCESTICLVGIVKSSNSVIRTCGTEMIGCRRNVGRWLHLCACDKPLCNTFSYLRSSAKHEDEVPSGSLIFSRIHSFNAVLECNICEDFSVDSNPLHPQPDAPLSTRTSFLTILLVGVPLAVGAATVVVVAFNYYCHLC